MPTPAQQPQPTSANVGGAASAEALAELMTREISRFTPAVEAAVTNSAG